MSSMMPVLDVTGLGITDPEYASSKMAVNTPVFKQSVVTQPRTVSVSAPSSVLKADESKRDRRCACWGYDTSHVFVDPINESADLACLAVPSWCWQLCA